MPTKSTRTPARKPRTARKIRVQRATSARDVPSVRRLRAWALAACPARADITLRIVAEREARRLNRSYRGRAYATNVLSFPYEDPPGVVTDILGDLVICAPLVQHEADEQHKSVEAHWAHLVVHGVLHLCGYDHIDAAQADEMEALETTILTGLGYSPPYDEQLLQQ